MPNRTADEAELAYAYEERAAIYEYDGHLPRDEAEARAYAEVYGPRQPAKRRPAPKQGGLFDD